MVDPWGLVSAGQLGIGNPGSYGGENDCESMRDDEGLEGWNTYWEYQYIAPTPEEYLGMLPIGGVGRGSVGKASLKRIKKLIKKLSRPDSPGLTQQKLNQLESRHIWLK